MTDEEIVESIIQIASSFGISCDDASYIVKSFENFGKEYMMSNIEDDIKEIKNFTKASILYGNKIGITTSQHNKLRKAMQNILSEREQDKARIKELEEKNRMLALEGSRVRLDLYIKQNYIPKQKVKEMQARIKELEEELYSANKIVEEYLDGIPKQKIKDKIENLEKEYKKLEQSSDFIIADTIQPKIEVLQELLQESEDK